MQMVLLLVMRGRRIGLQPGADPECIGVRLPVGFVAVAETISYYSTLLLGIREILEKMQRKLVAITIDILPLM